MIRHGNGRTKSCNGNGRNEIAMATAAMKSNPAMATAATNETKTKAATTTHMTHKVI